MQAVANANRDGRVHARVHAGGRPVQRGRRPRSRPSAEASAAAWSATARSCRWTKLRARTPCAAGAEARSASPGTRRSRTRKPSRRKAREACRALGITLLEANVDSSAGRHRGGAVAGVARRAGALHRRRQHDDVRHRRGHRHRPKRAGHPGVHDHARGEPIAGRCSTSGLDFHELGRARAACSRRASCGGADPATIPIRDVQDEVPTAARRQHARARRAEGAVAAARRCARGGDGRWSTTTGVHTRRGAIVGAARQDVARRVWCSSTACWTSRSRRKACSAGLKEAAWSRAATTSTTVPQRAGRHGDRQRARSTPRSASGADLLLTFSTPTLQAALQRARKRAHRLHLRREPDRGGRRHERHRSPAQRHRRLHAAAVRRDARADPRVLPSVHSVGTLFVPAEVNTVFNTRPAGRR